jgi:hypothetical protein
MVPKPAGDRPVPVFAAFLCALVAASPLSAQFGAVGLSSVRGQRFANENLIFYVPEQGDRFAAALAAGDFNGDGADDLAAGLPGDDNLGGSTPDSGIVVVRYGELGAGLDDDLADAVLSQDLPGSPDPAENGDNFGRSLVACDVNQDGFADLAVTVPGEGISGVEDVGAIQIVYGSAFGLVPGGNQFWPETVLGGSADAGDFVGAALAAGDFDGDGYADLAIGAPEEDEGGVADVGALVVLRGALFADGFERQNAGFWTSSVP